MWAATYGGGAACGRIAIYHNDTSHFAVISILCGLLHMVMELLVDLWLCITMTQTILLYYVSILYELLHVVVEQLMPVLPFIIYL